MTTTIQTVLRSFIQDEDGIAATEYVMLLGIIAIGLVFVIGTFRSALDAAWTSVNGQIFTW